MKQFILYTYFLLLFGNVLMPAVAKTKLSDMKKFNYVVDRFADVEVLRYEVHDFEQLPLQQKKLVYYLSEAALQGRDILFDQNYRHNLLIRQTLEAVYENYKGDRDIDEFKQFVIYLKRVWFSNGIHHHYGMNKFIPGFSSAYFAYLVRSIPAEKLPLQHYKNVDSLLTVLSPVLFDTMIDAKRVNLAEGEDLISTSANNYYQGLTQKEAEDFYAKFKDSTDQTPLSYGLNSRLVKAPNGDIVEYVYKVGGLFSAEIERIIYWLEKAITVAENTRQKEVIEKLIDFYRTGDLKTFDEYSILWVHDTDSHIDFLNGFIETYGDPLGIKASWEALVNFKNVEATKRTDIISRNAQWFEENSPIDKRFKKEKVKGVSAKVITAAILGGDCYPPTPIGINLPNANWIRQMHGSKSVTIENITEAYVKASMGNGFNEEFMWSKKEIDRKIKYGTLTDNLHTDLHECLGHGSGQLLPGVSPDALKAYGATMEEARADLFGLYYMGHPKIVQLGLLPNDEAYKAEYYSFMMNGLMTQLARITLGNEVEESHMRNRQLIARWVYEKGAPKKVVEMVKKGGKTYVKINDYNALQHLFGELLSEVQRIKSEGDYEAARKLVETYAVKIDANLHAEILERYNKLKLAPYRGFVNPVYTPVTDEKGEIIDVKIDYSEGFVEQHLRYSTQYSTRGLFTP
jgi:dipeptidyl-peptidase-3